MGARAGNVVSASRAEIFQLSPALTVDLLPLPFDTIRPSTTLVEAEDLSLPMQPALTAPSFPPAALNPTSRRSLSFRPPRLRDHDVKFYMSFPPPNLPTLKVNMQITPKNRTCVRGIAWRCVKQKVFTKMQIQE